MQTKQGVETARYQISDIKAMEILDPRGNPTVAAEIILDSGISGGHGSVRSLNRNAGSA